VAKKESKNKVNKLSLKSIFGLFVKKPKTVKPMRAKKEPKGIFKILISIGRYFQGAWIELKQVRWPNRKATWSLTLAVILFTTFFFILIVLLDAGFKELFNLILK
jgi:preprotein translocase subunit SecE